MKIISFVLPCLLVLAGCSTPSQPEAPKPPQIGMANPASVYCQQKGGTLIPVQTAQGVISLLTLRLLQAGSRKSLRFLHKKSDELSSNCHLCTLTIT
ncbi:TPA: DUF333 domain-containing protein [Escherichia coli]|nr:DUF333 domain-containing protein [Escherichia coli]